MSIKLTNKSKKVLPYSQYSYQFYHAGGGENEDKKSTTEQEWNDAGVADIADGKQSDVPLFSRRQKGNYVISGYKAGFYAKSFPYLGHEGLVRLRIECENDASTWVEIILNQYDIRNMKQMAYDFLEEDMITELRLKVDKLKKEILNYRRKESEASVVSAGTAVISESV